MQTAGATLVFGVSTFKRVFDTTPALEVLTLPELVACFRRFELKPEVEEKIKRDVSRIDAALARYRGGEEPGGKILAELWRVHREALRDGRDATASVTERAEALRDDARRSAKRDLRLWSPAVYREGWTTRDSEGVECLSCLVLDLDRGDPVEDAIGPWEAYFFMLHSTWSYTPQMPKVRLVVPLNAPVLAEDWHVFWDWAQQRCGGKADVALSGRAATFALPAVGSSDSARLAITHAGPVLDPRALGLDLTTSNRRLPRSPAGPSVMRGDAEKRYVSDSADDGL